jgi:hypothetical protein
MEKLSALKPRLPVLCPERLLFDMRNGTWLVETIRCPAGDACITEREGQRTTVPRQQAEHKTASDNVSITKKDLQKGSHPHRTKHRFRFVFLSRLRHIQNRQFVPLAETLCSSSNHSGKPALVSPLTIALSMFPSLNGSVRRRKSPVRFGLNS